MPQIHADAEIVSNETSADIVADSFVETFLDLGHSIIYRLSHPKLGRLVVLNSSVGDSGIIRI